MLPLGIFLTKRATADRGLFEFDHIIEPIKKALKLKPNNLTSLINLESENNTINNEDLIIFNKRHNDYKTHAQFSFVFYSISLVLFILFFVFKNNKLESIASASIQLCGISTFIFTIYYIKSYINIVSLYKLAIEKEYKNNLQYIVFGFFFYPLKHLLRKNKIREDFSVSSK